MLRLVRKDEGGQVLVIGLFVAVGLAMISIAVANVGMMVSEKIRLQDSVDAAAYSAAVVEARYMNLSAYLNRTMVANYNSMAFNTALWSTVDSTDHGLAVVITTLYGIASILQIFPPTNGVGTTLTQITDVLESPVHEFFHGLNAGLKRQFSQIEGDNDLNQYLEIYNTEILSLYQGLILAAAQSARYEVARQVAEKMDSDVITTTVLGFGAETVSADELAAAVDYVVANPAAREDISGDLSREFNELASPTAELQDPDTSDHPVLLAAVTEASLDKFTAGRTREGLNNIYRQFNTGNLIPISGAIEEVLEENCQNLRRACNLTIGIIPGLCDYSCDATFQVGVGTFVRDKQELDLEPDHIPFIARQRMRQVNFFGLRAEVVIPDQLFPPFSVITNLLSEILGGISQEADAVLSFLNDLGKFNFEQGYTSGNRFTDHRNKANLLNEDLVPDDRAFTCAVAEIFGGDKCDLNEKNDEYGTLFGLRRLVQPNYYDYHWDGHFDVRPTKYTKLTGVVGGLVDLVDYWFQAFDEGVAEGVTMYDWRVDLDNVGFPHYHYDESIAPERVAGNSRGENENRLAGPSVAVMGVKRAEDVNGLRGLRIGNEHSMTAVSRAQVYYLRNPNRPNERASLFNPHWAARLAPIDADDTPALLRRGLPFLGSQGVPINPTH